MFLISVVAIIFILQWCTDGFNFYPRPSYQRRWKTGLVNKDLSFLRKTQWRSFVQQIKMSRYSFGLEQLQKLSEEDEAAKTKGIKTPRMVEEELKLKARQLERDAEAEDAREFLAQAEHLASVRRKFLQGEDVPSFRTKAQEDRYAKSLFKKYPQLRRPYNYSSDDGTVFEYPFVEHPKWYRAFVQRGHEKIVAERITAFNTTEADPLFGIINDVFFMQAPKYYFGRRNKSISTVDEPMIVQVSSRVTSCGYIYVKCPMNPSIGADLEGILGLNRISRNPETKSIEPIDGNEESSLEELINAQRNAFTIPRNCQGVERYEYVRITNGPYRGSYGIVKDIISRSLMFQVALRYDGKTIDVVSVDIHDVEPLADPPEVHYKSITTEDSLNSFFIPIEKASLSTPQTDQLAIQLQEDITLSKERKQELLDQTRKQEIKQITNSLNRQRRETLRLMREERELLEREFGPEWIVPVPMVVDSLTPSIDIINNKNQDGGTHSTINDYEANDDVDNGKELDQQSEDQNDNDDDENESDDDDDDEDDDENENEDSDDDSDNGGKEQDNDNDDDNDENDDNDDDDDDDDEKDTSEDEEIEESPVSTEVEGSTTNEYASSKRQSSKSETIISTEDVMLTNQTKSTIQALQNVKTSHVALHADDRLKVLGDLVNWFDESRRQYVLEKERGNTNVQHKPFNISEFIANSPFGGMDDDGELDKAIPEYKEKRGIVTLDTGEVVEVVERPRNLYHLGTPPKIVKAKRVHDWEWQEELENELKQQVNIDLFAINDYFEIDSKKTPKSNEHATNHILGSANDKSPISSMSLLPVTLTGSRETINNTPDPSDFKSFPDYMGALEEFENLQKEIRRRDRKAKDSTNEKKITLADFNQKYNFQFRNNDIHNDEDV